MQQGMLQELRHWQLEVSFHTFLDNMCSKKLFRVKWFWKLVSRQQDPWIEALLVLTFGWIGHFIFFCTYEGFLQLILDQNEVNTFASLSFSIISLSISMQISLSWLYVHLHPSWISSFMMFIFWLSWGHKDFILWQ